MKKILVLALLILGSVFIVSDLMDDDSDATDTSSTTSYWICYGRVLVFEDENYDASKYSYICWQVADNQSDLNTADKHEVPKYEVILNPSEYPSYQSKQIYARLTTVVNGEQIITDLTVIVNPIDEVCYVLFMYDDNNGYKYQPITSTKSINLSKEFIVDVPEKDPKRNGYRFDGWYVDKSCKVPFDKNAVFEFKDNVREHKVYPKWVGSSEEHDLVYVTLQQINGVKYTYDSLIVERGKSFDLKMDVFDDYKVDLSGISSTVIDKAGKGSVIEPSGVSESSCKFTFDNITDNITVVFSNYVVYSKIVYSMGDGVSIHGATVEWVKYGAPFNASFDHDSPGIDINVYRNGDDITTTSVDGDTVSIGSVTGTIYIFAEPSDSKADDSIPMYLFAVVAIVVIMLIAALFYIHRRNAMQ